MSIIMKTPFCKTKIVIVSFVMVLLGGCGMTATSGDNINVSGCKICSIEEDANQMQINFECTIDDEVQKGSVISSFYNGYGMDVDKRVKAMLLDLDGDSVSEIIMKVNYIGNTLSENSGDLHVIKIQDNEFEEILHQGENWSTPNGDWIIELIIQNGELYYVTGKKDTTNSDEILTECYQLVYNNDEFTSLQSDIVIDENTIVW